MGITLAVQGRISLLEREHILIFVDLKLVEPSFQVVEKETREVHCGDLLLYDTPRQQSYIKKKN